MLLRVTCKPVHTLTPVHTCSLAYSTQPGTPGDPGVWAGTGTSPKLGLYEQFPSLETVVPLCAATNYSGLITSLIILAFHVDALLSLAGFGVEG